VTAYIVRNKKATHLYVCVDPDSVGGLGFEASRKRAVRFSNESDAQTIATRFKSIVEPVELYDRISSMPSQAYVPPQVLRVACIGFERIVDLPSTKAMVGRLECKEIALDTLNYLRRVVPKDWREVDEEEEEILQSTKFSKLAANMEKARIIK